MRVFEALCSGSLLITDHATGSGLDELFNNKEHLVLYDDKDLEETIAYYLDNEADRESIARKGRKEVLAKHTYKHRADAMIQVLNHSIGKTREQDTITTNDKPDSYYKNVRNDFIPLIPMDAKYILEVGLSLIHILTLTTKA